MLLMWFLINYFSITFSIYMQRFLIRTTKKKKEEFCETFQWRSKITYLVSLEKNPGQLERKSITNSSRKNWRKAWGIKSPNLKNKSKKYPQHPNLNRAPLPKLYLQSVLFYDLIVGNGIISLRWTLDPNLIPGPQRKEREWKRR